jgi:hypothetical protein
MQRAKAIAVSRYCDNKVLMHAMGQIPNGGVNALGRGWTMESSPLLNGILYNYLHIRYAY